MINIDFNDVEASIQYEFKNKMLIQQAFMITDNDNIPFSSEALRNIGKRTINYSITQILTGYYGYYNERGLFRTKNSNEHFNDLLNNLYSKDIFARNIELLGLSKYLDFNRDTDVFNIDRKLFEAIVGAVALDSNWNMNVINEVLSFILDIDYYLDNGFGDLNGNFVVLVHNWTLENDAPIPVYDFMPGDNQNIESYKSVLHLFLNGTDFTFTEEAENKSIARMKAAKKAYTYLVENNYVKTLKNIDIKPELSSAMMQLEKLSMDGHFSLPEFDVFEENGGYAAICTIDECDMSFKGYGKIDSDAINEAAFKMLNHVLGYDAK